MSAFLLPASCRCPQRSMLSHFVTPPTTARRARTRTRVITTASRSRSSLVSQNEISASSSFASQPFLLNANVSQSETKIFAPLYQMDTPLPPQYRYQLPFNAPPAPAPSPSHQQHQHVYPSHQERVKRQASLRHASYASRTIPAMMGPAPRPSKIQFDRAFLDLVKRRLDEDMHHASHHFDYCKDKPLREAAVFM
ncbi:hypothetical protein BGZ54_002520, partial [Gamsiella multidivaricata]